MGDEIFRTSNATSAALVAFSEGRPNFDGFPSNSETTTPLHDEPTDLGAPKDLMVKKTNVSSLYDSIIFVKVGPEMTNFGIHRGLVCHHSSYFDRALNGGFREAIEGEVILADEDSATFTRFNEWLYTGVVLFGNETEMDILYKPLVNLYIFAEKRGVVHLQNAVIDCIIKKNLNSADLPNTYIRHAWNNTADSSPLHALLVDLYVRKANFVDIMDDEKKRSRFDKDILVAFVLAFHRLKKERASLDNYDFWRNRCLYHVHNDSVPPCQPSLVTGSSTPKLRRPKIASSNTFF